MNHAPIVRFRPYLPWFGGALLSRAAAVDFFRRRLLDVAGDPPAVAELSNLPPRLASRPVRLRRRAIALLARRWPQAAAFAVMAAPRSELS